VTFDGVAGWMLYTSDNPVCRAPTARVSLTADTCRRGTKHFSRLATPGTVFETLRMQFFRVKEDGVSSSSEIGSRICSIPLKVMIGDPLQVHFVLTWPLLSELR
jgi:hypothetical protein